MFAFARHHGVNPRVVWGGVDTLLPPRCSSPPGTSVSLKNNYLCTTKWAFLWSNKAYSSVPQRKYKTHVDVVINKFSNKETKTAFSVQSEQRRDCTEMSALALTPLQKVTWRRMFLTLLQLVNGPENEIIDVNNVFLQLACRCKLKYHLWFLPQYFFRYM